MTGGYIGRYLQVDLTTGRITARALDERDAERFVGGSGLAARLLAQAVAALTATGHYGIYHLTNAGFCSRYEFATEIVRLAGLTAPVTPILSAEWPRPSRPPLHAILANTAGAALGITMRPWGEALAEYVAWLADERRTTNRTR